MAIFEAPIAHEAVHYSNPELEGEFEDEASPYSTPESPYSNPEYEYEGLLGNIISGIGGLLGGGEVGEAHELAHEYEWEEEFEDEASSYSYPEHAYSMPEGEYEGLLGNIISGIGGLLGGGEVGEVAHEYEWEEEFEDEASPYSYPEHGYSMPEGEYEGLLGNIISGIGGLLGGGEVGEWEYEASPYSNPELEYEEELEADLFFKRFRRAIGRVARSVAPIARRLAPGAARALVSMIPGVGMIAGPLAGKLVGSLVREAEMEVAEMEQHFLTTLAETCELENP